MNAVPLTTQVVDARLAELRNQMRETEQQLGRAHAHVGEIRRMIARLENERAVIVAAVAGLMVDAA